MISFRPLLSRGDADAHRFVVDAWCRSYQPSDTAGIIGGERWFAVMIPELERIIDRHESRTLLAVSPDADPGIADVHGFMVHEVGSSVPIVHFVYVKEAYRRCGIARALFAAAGIDPTRTFVYTATTAMLSTLRREPHRLPFARWDVTPARYESGDHRRRTR